MALKIAVVGFGFTGMTHSLNILSDATHELNAIVDRFPPAIQEKLKAVREFQYWCNIC